MMHANDQALANHLLRLRRNAAREPISQAAGAPPPCARSQRTRSTSLVYKWRTTIDQLEHRRQSYPNAGMDQCLEIDRAIVSAHRMDGQNVRVIERGGRLRFLFKPTQPVRVRGKMCQYLDGDIAVPLQIMRPVYFSHASRSEQRQYLIR